MGRQTAAWAGLAFVAFLLLGACNPPPPRASSSDLSRPDTAGQAAIYPGIPLPLCGEGLNHDACQVDCEALVAQCPESRPCYDIAFPEAGLDPALYSPKCCGDDAKEAINAVFWPCDNFGLCSNPQTNVCDSGLNCPATAAAGACCDAISDCAFGSRCYDNVNNKAGANLANLGGPRPNYAFCQTITGFFGGWVDCDAPSVTGIPAYQCDGKASGLAYDRNACYLAGTREVTRAGAAGVGEYADRTSSECCGDDPNEYLARDGTATLCCPHPNSAIVNNGCVQQASLQIVAVSPAVGSIFQNVPLRLTLRGFYGRGTIRVGSLTFTTFQFDPSTGPDSVVTVQIPPRASAPSPSTVDITVQNDRGESATSPQAYTFFDPTPTLTGVEPPWGPPSGGTPVIIRGRSFIQGMTLTFAGSAYADTGFIVKSTTEISFVTPPHPAGPVPVGISAVVEGRATTSTLSPGFTYSATPLAAPDILGVAPATATTTGGGELRVTGRNFQAGATAKVGGKDAPTTFLTSSSLLIRAPPHPRGTYDLAVTNPNGFSDTLPQAITYLDPIQLPPHIDAIAPAEGPSAGNTRVTITGRNFAPGATVAFGGLNAPIEPVFFKPSPGTDPSVSVLSVIAPAHPVGRVAVKVTNPDAQFDEVVDGYTYTTSAPSVIFIIPAYGWTTGGNVSLIVGFNLAQVTAVYLGQNPATVFNKNDTAFAIRAPPGPAGWADVRLYVGNSVHTKPQAYLYQLPTGPPPPPPPSDLVVTGVTPRSGPTVGGTQLEITGTGFSRPGHIAGAIVKLDGQPIPAIGISDTKIIAETRPHTPGRAALTVINPDLSETTLQNAFEFLQVPPAIDSVLPPSGPTIGGALVGIQGANFGEGMAVKFGGLAADFYPGFLSATQAVVVTPPHAAGPVDVSIEAPWGSATKAAAYTYSNAPSTAITLTGLWPGSGPLAGGTPLLVTGANFDSSAIIYLGGSPLLTTFINANSLSAITPPHAAGRVPVTVRRADGQASANLLLFEYIDTGAAQLRLIRVNPGTGPHTGNTPVLLEGANFAEGLLILLDTQVLPTTRIDATRASIIMPPHSPGSVALTARNPDGQAFTLQNAYTYLGPSGGLSITSITPAQAPAAGGLLHIISGTGFTPATAVSFGTTPAATVYFVDAATLGAVSPPHAPGVVDILVSQPGGTFTLPASFTYTQPPGGGACTDGTADGQCSATKPKRCSGGQLVDACATCGCPSSQTCQSSGACSVPPGQRCPDGTAEGQCSATKPKRCSGGQLVDACATCGCPSSQTCQAAGTCGAAAAGPTILVLVPDKGPVDGGSAVTAYGNNFASGATLKVDAQAVPATFVNDHELRFTTPPHAEGPAAVTVTNPDAQAATKQAAFAYLPVLDLARVVPPEGYAGHYVYLVGRGFRSGAKVFFGGVQAQAELFNSTNMSVRVPPHAPGFVDVEVRNPDNAAKALANAFRYLGLINLTPALQSLSPAAGPARGGTNVALWGQNFIPGLTVEFDRTNASAASVSFLNATTMHVIAPPHAIGQVDVRLYHPAGAVTALPASYTYTPVSEAPTITGISPRDGSTTGGTSVTITGTNFAAGVAADFDGVLAPSTRLDATRLTITTPPHAAGPATIEIRNPDGASASWVRGFTYLLSDYPLPTIALLQPNSGPVGGGTTVALWGTNYYDETGALFADQAVEATFVNSTLLFLTTPPHAAGIVSVTVKNPGGKTTTKPDAFRYAANQTNITDGATTREFAFRNSEIYKVVVRDTAAQTYTLTSQPVPASSDGPQGKKVYARLRLTGNRDPSGGATAHFRVSKTWTSRDRVDPDTVLLYRQTVGWEPLATARVRDDATDYYYESTTPAFSVFLIAGETRETCGDGLKNQGEEGIDCGGPCPDLCFIVDHCTNGKQDIGEDGKDCGGTCLTPCQQEDTCGNGKPDPGEQGTDCGGPCPPCKVDLCKNLKRDSGELGVDCGGPCPKACPPPAHCADGKKANGETGTDCGGECPACPEEEEAKGSRLFPLVGGFLILAIAGVYIYLKFLRPLPPRRPGAGKTEQHLTNFGADEFPSAPREPAPPSLKAPESPGPAAPAPAAKPSARPRSGTATVGDLRAFIAEAARKGYTEPEIRKCLAKAGWRKDLINRALKR